MEAVIFDLDGVLTSTDHYHYLAWKAMADKENIYFDEEINKRLRGVSRMDCLNIILERSQKKYSDSEKEVLANYKNELYRHFLDDLGPKDVSNDVLSTLKILKNKGYKLAVASSSKNTILVLNRCELTNYFDTICDGNMVKKAKPDPEIFLLAAKKLNVNPKNAIVIEDAEFGIEAGNRGGFITCAVGEARKTHKASYDLEKVSDLVNILEPNQHTIQIQHLKKVYPNGVEAVKDFSIDIENGEFVVFVGPSGCGKSTVLRMIAGLEDITEGTLLIDGNDMTDSEPKDRDIAMVFQNYALYPHKSVKENIGFSLYMKNVPLKHFFDFKYRKARRKDIDQKVAEVAEKIGLTPYLDRKPKNLSGGQRQRVALGRAIIRNPKAFLLDEPLSNLDAKMRAEMRTEISKLHNDLHAIFIYVTHDQIEAMTMGSKIVVMKDGIIQQIGTPQEVFMNPVNMFVAGFIGTPQMNFFDASLIRSDDTYQLSMGGHQFDLPDRITRKIKENYEGKEIVLGIRPKAITVSENGDIEGTVSICEQLGDEALIYFNTFDTVEHIASMATYQNFEPGSTVNLHLDLEYCSLFDKESGESILK